MADESEYTIQSGKAVDFSAVRTLDKWNAVDSVCDRFLLADGSVRSLHVSILANHGRLYLALPRLGYGDRAICCYGVTT
jgi:hypothetical protein